MTVMLQDPCTHHPVAIGTHKGGGSREHEPGWECKELRTS